MPAGFLRASDPRWQDGSHNAFYDLALKVTLLHFHSILVIIQDSPIQLGEGYIMMRIPGSGARWGPSGKVATAEALNKTDKVPALRVNSLRARGRQFIDIQINR